VSDPDLDHGCARSRGGGGGVHCIAPREGNIEPYLRHSEDVLVLRLALRKILTDGGEGAPAFRIASPKILSRLGKELELLDRACGKDLVAWLDCRWAILCKAVYARKKIPMFVDDEEVGTLLYDEGMKFGTNYPISEKSLEGRFKQASRFWTTCSGSGTRTRRKSPRTRIESRMARSSEVVPFGVAPCCRLRRRPAAWPRAKFPFRPKSPRQRARWPALWGRCRRTRCVARWRRSSRPRTPTTACNGLQ